MFLERGLECGLGCLGLRETLGKSMGILFLECGVGVSDVCEKCFGERFRIWCGLSWVV